MKTGLRYFIIGVLIFLLISVRGIGKELFYDPLIDFFKNDHLGAILPEIQYGKFYLSLVFRFCLNTLFSVGIIFLLFPKQDILAFTLKIYLIAFLLLVVVFAVLIHVDVIESHRPLFYVRRFLIHPVLLLILCPAFYHKQLKKDKKEK